MKYQQTNGVTIQFAFEQFHSDNPDVYEHFKRFAFAWLNTGAKKISAKQICGRIRWFIQVETTGKFSEDFKLNDAFTSRYARMFEKDYPQHDNKFEKRTIRSL